MPEYRKVKLSELSRRELMKMASSATFVGASVGLAGCVGGDGGDGGGGGGGNQSGGNGSGGGSSDLQSAVSNIGYGENWEERRGLANPSENWAMESRLQVPESDLGASDSWIDTETVKSATWEPPSGWDDTAASDVDTIEILNYGDMQFDRATAATDALFEDRTGIKMSRTQVVVDQAIPKAAAFLSSKQSSPQMLLSTTYSSMSTYANNGYLEPVDFIQPDDAMWEPYLPIAEQTFQFNGTQWGGPNIIEGKVVHLRPQLIRDQGVDGAVVDSILAGDYTWTDLETVMEAFAGTDVAGWGYRGSSLTYTENDWREMWYQAGGGYKQGGDDVTVNTDSGLYALERMIEWKDKGWVPDAVTTWTQGDLADGFLSESLAMVPVATDLIADSVEQFGKGDSYQIAPPPRAPDDAADPQHATLATTTVSAINAFAPIEHKIAGTLFQDARFSYASSWWEYVEEGNMAYVEQVYEDAADQATFSQQKGAAMETAKSEVFPQQRAINQEVSEQLQLAIAGDKEPQKALEDAQSFIDTVLSQ